MCLTTRKPKPCPLPSAKLLLWDWFRTVLAGQALGASQGSAPSGSACAEDHGPVVVTTYAWPEHGDQLWGPFHVSSPL